MPRCRRLLLASLIGSVLTLGGCAVGPDYRRPEPQALLAYKEQGDWKASEPADALAHGPWWRIFSDPVLDQLESQIDISNQNLKASWDAYLQSRALVLQAQNAYWPTVGVTAARQRSNQYLPPDSVRNVDSAGVTGTWSLDIWGATRRSVESDRDSAQASHAAVTLARL